MRPIRLTFGTNKTHEVAMCHVPFPDEKVLGQGQSDRLHSRSHWPFEVFVYYVAVCLIDRFPSVSQKQPMKGWNVAYIFHVNRCKSKLGRSFKVSAMSILWLLAHHMRHSKFLPCPTYSSVPTWPIRFMCGTNTTHEGAALSLSMFKRVV